MNYDPMGNITKFDSVSGTIHYQYNSSTKRLESTTGQKAYSFSYDERGNVTDNGFHSFTFNLANQMVSADGNDYIYDGHSRRVKTDDGNGVRYSMYLMDGTLIYERINGNNREYYYLGNQLVAQQGAGAKTYIHPDLLGSSSAKSDVNKIVARFRYAPFGSAWGKSEQNEIGYTGHKFDTDIGLSYMQARYYDPVIGRFYSNDPVGPNRTNPIMSFNRYIYVNNNPYKYTDPTGMELECPTTTRCTVTVPRPKVTTTGLRNIIFNESRSLSGNSERRVRRFMAHTILNGDEKYGENRPSTASDKLGNIIDPSELKLLEEIEGIIKQVYFERSEGIDSVGGAMHFNFRDLNFLKVYNKDLMSPMHGRDVKYSIGPLKNSYPTKELGSAGIYFTVYQ